MEEESDRSDPGTAEEEEEEVLTEEDPLPLHPSTPPLHPPPLSLSPPLSVAAIPPDRLPPAADPPTRIKCTPRLSPSTGIMNQTHPRCTPENDRALKLLLTPQTETEVWSSGEGVEVVVVGEEVVPLWSLRTSQSAKEALENRT